MSSLLAEAVAQLNLKPGQTYRTELNGHTIEVRMLEDDEPTPELAEQVMLQPWVEFPIPPGVSVKCRPGPIDPPDPVVIPSDEGEE